MNKARKIVTWASILFLITNVMLPAWLCPLHAFVPQRYFLRSRAQLEKTANPGDFNSYLTRQAFPYMLALVFGLLIWAGIVWFSSSVLAAYWLLAAIVALPVLTLFRLLSGGGFSGGI